VLGAAVEALGRELGSRPADLRVALGPSIGPCCFEVGPEVAEAFATALPGAAGVVLERLGAKPHVDLRRAQRLQLEAAGLAGAHIDPGAACTMCDPAGRFFSYRRDATLTGQHVGFIAPAPPGGRFG
jgi:copper oxidase (laccase) domain-containing protein